MFNCKVHEGMASLLFSNISPRSVVVLSNRNVMRASIYLNFLIVMLKESKKKEGHFNNIFNPHIKYYHLNIESI